MDESRRDRDEEGRARNARPRDGLGRPLPYGTPGVERQPEGVVRSAEETVREAQRLLDAGMPFHAHEVFEDAWKSGPDTERELWRGLAQMSVGLTHAARGNTTGGARLLRRGAAAVEGFRTSDPHGIGVDRLVRWARELAGRVESTGPGDAEEDTGGGRHDGGDERGAAAVDAAAEAPRLRQGGRAGE
ncbi:DUF309 domain-containing protein [Streptomyces sp. HB132]|uniref:DUF309 domain-containing protein n=1 Tax=Streptomyces sp. HB132 TaxID=767388 RepID=UPI0019616EEA|nr:DUF309 domain-containing protein [Streptomyces sp. HB132]MBM7442942.1 hypothetical protein [Streptomyces sp. HB132]